MFDRDKKERKTLKIFGGNVFTTDGETEGFNSFCAIAAHVTSYSRVLLLKYIEKAGWPNVYYCDTDSLFLNEAGYQSLKDVLSDSEIGKLKLEKEGNLLEIHAPKDYQFDDKVTMKGIKKGSILLDNGEQPVFETEQWPRLNSAIREGNLSGYRTKKIRKVLYREYNKAWINLNGEALPFRFDLLS